MGMAVAKVVRTGENYALFSPAGNVSFNLSSTAPSPCPFSRSAIALRMSRSGKRVDFTHGSELLISIVGESSVK
jgi:hypothetical protein